MPSGLNQPKFQIGYSAWRDVRYLTLNTQIQQNAGTTKFSVWNNYIDDDPSNDTPLVQFGMGSARREYIDPVWSFDYGNKLNFRLPYFGYGRSYYYGPNWYL